MNGDAGTTAFITGAAGFMDTELFKILEARGHRRMRRRPRKTHPRGQEAHAVLA
jgi:hypothetical protein